MYLGLHFTPNGRFYKQLKINDDLNKLKRALLKPKQELYLVTHLLLPSYYHQLILGKIFTGHLKNLDLKVRKFVRELFHLPLDIPLSAFHASVKHGGMGIPCLRGTVTVMAFNVFQLIQIE